MSNTTATQQADFEEFLYVITHDFKASARAMLCLPEWISEDLAAAGVGVPQNVGEHIQMLQNSARQMEKMLEGLTEFSRVGRMADAPQTHDLTDLLQRCWQDCERDRGRLRLDVDGVQILGPENDLRRLFTAIFDNAIRHGDKGRVTLDVSCADTGAQAFRIAIADDGIGVPEEFREQVFGPLRGLRSRDETGCAGMGLSIARKVVDGLGGEIRIGAPQPGQGCVVTIDLPKPPVAN